MFHSGTRRLIGLWTRLGALHGFAPPRSALDPADLRDLLPLTVMLGLSLDGARFRLAGELARDLHARPLNDVPFLDLWDTDSQPLVARTLREAVRECSPVVIVAWARTADGAQAPLEMPMVPLKGPSGRTDRLLGLYLPTAGLAGIEGRGGARLAARLAGRTPAVSSGRALTLATVDGRRVG